MAEILDRRTAMEEAFDSAEADAKGEVYTPPVHETPEKVATETTQDPDPAEVEANAEAKPVAKERPRTKGVPLDERTAPVEKAAEDPNAPKVSALDKAPLGWGPKRAELWARVPADIRSVINKREYEAQNAMSQAGRIRAIAEEYHQVIMPFENVIRSMNSTPKDAIKNVMTTATALIVGTQAQKCAVLTEMIQRYGVDLPELDKTISAALKNGDKQSIPQANNPNAPMDPRIMSQLQPLFQMQQRLLQQETQRQQQLSQEATEQINSVADEKYFADVREDMADIMEISAKRGHIMTIQQAYAKAIQIHPEISKLATKTTPNNALARARKAASTVRGAPGGPVNSGKTDRRSALEAAWDSA
jgi:hypothetical protein